MTFFVLLAAPTRTWIVPTWVMSHYIHDFQEVLHLPFVAVRVFTPEILPSPINTEFICVGESVEKWNYQFIKEVLNTKLLTISVLETQATRAILRINVQVNNWNLAFFRDSTVFPTDFIHFWPSVPI